MNANNRIIRTNLYSKIAYDILRSVEGQLSDGIWENSRSAEKYWRFLDVTTAPDGEVLIEVSKESYKTTPLWLNNAFYDMSNDDVKRWFAGKIKQIAQIELKDNENNDGWKRDNDTYETQYLSYNTKITVADTYFVYDFLMGRDTSKKYGVMEITSVIGTAKSEADTKAEELRREKKAKLIHEWSDCSSKLKAEKKVAIEKLEAEFGRKQIAINDEFKAKIDALMA